MVSVLFADLVGFTGLSEQLDHEQVKHLVDGAFERLVHDVVSFGGRVDKIVGDAIVALFGAPVAHEDDAERAVRAALRMQEALAAAREVASPFTVILEDPAGNSALVGEKAEKVLLEEREA